MTASDSSRADANGKALAPWLQRQLDRLLAQPAHALLLHGPSGLGQYPLALALASAWLCDEPTAAGACGRCASCHAIAVRTHADLHVLMPEVTLQELGWPLDEKAQTELDDKKRKPSREIRVDAMREAIEFSQRTSAGSRGKVVLVYPAECMNAVAANALLKTLEEPTGALRFVLATQAVRQLLPTVRSRCQSHAMDWPAGQELLPWLHAHGVEPQAAAIWLRAAGGRPEAALALARRGLDAEKWSALPKAVQHGNAGLLADWSPPEIVQALHKICHDMQLCHFGAEPRFFLPQDLPAPIGFAALSRWGRALTRAARTMEHPFNPGLMQEALLDEAKIALNSRH